MPTVKVASGGCATAPRRPPPRTPLALRLVPVAALCGCVYVVRSGAQSLSQPAAAPQPSTVTPPAVATGAAGGLEALATELVPRWRDFGGEGLAAALIAAETGVRVADLALLPFPPSLVDSARDGHCLADASKCGSDGALAAAVLRRICRRRSCGAAAGLSGAGVVVGVAPAPAAGCAADEEWAREVLSCRPQCGDGAVLVPAGDLHAGFAALRRSAGIAPPELLTIGAGPGAGLLPAARECPSVAALHDFAVAGRAASQADAAALRSASAALPNYCQGMHSASACSMLKGGGWRPSLPQPARVVGRACPHGSDDFAATGGDAVSTAMDGLTWPACQAWPAGCTFPRGLVFVKTHKTASSTLESIFHRVCYNRRLRCFTHSGKFVNVEYPEQMQEALLPHADAPELSPPYDMWVAHVAWSAALPSLVRGGRAAAVVTIVREPAARFRSHWNFWVGPSDFVAPGRWPWRAAELQAFCDTVSSNESLMHVLQTEPLNIRLALDNMARQMLGCTHCGLGEELNGRMRPLLRDARDPASGLIVLFTERFPESLLLLRRVYGFRLAELAFVSRNSGSYNRKAGGDRLNACLRRINVLDTAFFDAAAQGFEGRLARAFPNGTLGEELREFDALRKGVTSGCRGGWSCSRGGASHSKCLQCDLVDGRVDVTRGLVRHFKTC
eukprot:TRINITY_DN32527_c0_g1_i1.p1 TRINITY_DN32527_c0_g1~~TRINITY_DN32527_c0_g1_i1.p1  ORF type:complete len:674 (+),score=190.85 TRINITY_DN32527_c0_g1_i1:59-2080(+)